MNTAHAGYKWTEISIPHPAWAFNTEKEAHNESRVSANETLMYAPSCMRFVEGNLERKYSGNANSLKLSQNYYTVVSIIHMPGSAVDVSNTSRSYRDRPEETRQPRFSILAWTSLPVRHSDLVLKSSLLGASTIATSIITLLSSRPDLFS